MQFTELPCQALHCSIAGIEPVFPHGNAKGAMQDSWPSKVCCWLSRLILGNPVNIVVTSCIHNNQTSLEVYLPANDLLCKDSLTDIPIPAQNLANLSKWRDAHSLVNLASFMCSVGLAKEPESLYHRHELPGSVVQLSLQNSQSDFVRSDQLASAFRKTANSAVLLESTLQPLSVELGPSCEFTLLISSIVSPNKFFVHPIQENIASAMVELSTRLNEHYSNPANNAPLSDDCAHSGTHCCVYAENDHQWFRGVITFVRENHGSPTSKDCLVYSLDYGDTNWVPLKNLQIMKEEFCVYPALCVCCTLSGVSPISGSSTEELEEGSIVYFYELTESLSLIAVVNTEGMPTKHYSIN